MTAPLRGASRPSPTANCATKCARSLPSCRIWGSPGRQGRYLHAHDPAGHLRHARLRPHRRHSLGRVRGLCLGNSPPASRMTPKLVISASCGIEPGSCPTSRCWTRPSGYQRTSPTIASCSSATSSAANCRTAVTSTMPKAISKTRPRGALRAGCRDRSALHPLHFRHDGAAEGRGAGQWRPYGRAQMDDETQIRHRPGEVFWAASDVGWVVGHSYIVYAPLLHGATTVLFEGKAGWHSRCGRVLAHHLRIQGSGPVYRAYRIPRHQARDPGEELIRKYDLSVSHALSGRRARDPKP